MIHLLKKKAPLRIGAFLVALGIVVVFATTAVAVHNVGVFELDGNATDSTSAASLPDDWDRVFAGTDHATGGSSFKHEAANKTIFTGGGSKDDLDIDQWLWKDGSAPDKDDLLDAFAARYTCTLAAGCTGDVGDVYLYFGADRFDGSGDAQMGFWFLQGEVAPQGNGKGNGTGFGPDKHVIGDILILSDFTGGGADSHIRVFMWDPTHTPASELVDGTLLPLAGSETTPATCGSSNTDDFCAIVNNPSGTSTTASPWPFEDKSHKTGFLNGELYEGGVNLSNINIPGGGNLAGECFASFIAETRSSASVDSVLKDFLLDSFQPCESGIVTTPTNSTVLVGSSNTDEAVVTGQGAGTPTGTVQFFLCSPSQLDDASPTDDPNTCDVGGTQVGSPVEGEDLVADPNDATKATATSDATVALSSVGTWCFRGVYVPALGSPYDTATDSATTECFQVQTVASNITSTPSVYPNDSATISIPSGQGGNPTGSVKFRLFDTLANCQATTPSDTVGQGGLLYKQTIPNLPATAPFTVSTSNTTVSVSADSTVAWLVEFTSSNNTQRSRKSVCVERTALDFTGDPGPGTE